jgi:RNA polymerase sigma factor (sigma-70 family)
MDNQMLTAISKGDVVSYTIMYNKYFKYLTRIASRYSRSVTDQQEYAQCALIKTWEHRKLQCNVICIEAYLDSCLKHVAIEIKRKEKVARKWLFFQNTTCMKNYNNVDKHMRSIDQRQQLSKALESLPLHHQIIYDLYLDKEMTTKQVCDKTGLSITSVHNYANLTRKYLRKHLQYG